MSITREQQADLYRGDTLELKFNQDGAALTLRGTFPEITNFYDNYLGGPYTLTVVSRAPRPLYVNHPRTEPVAGDIVRNDEDEEDRRTWMFRAHTDAPEWTTHVGRDGPGNVIETHQRRPSLPRSLRLLIDGETGQVVP